MFSFDLYLVLSYCQVWQIPAVLYQCYTDVIKLDTVTIEAFKPLLSTKILKSLVKVKFRIYKLMGGLVYFCLSFISCILLLMCSYEDSPMRIPPEKAEKYRL